MKWRQTAPTSAELPRVLPPSPALTAKLINGADENLPRKGKRFFVVFFNAETRSPRVTSSHPLRGVCVFVVGVH